MSIIIKPYITAEGEQITSIFDGNELLGSFRVAHDSVAKTSQWSFNGVLLDTAFFQDALVKAMEMKGYVVEGDSNNVEFFARSSENG